MLIAASCAEPVSCIQELDKTSYKLNDIVQLISCSENAKKYSWNVIIEETPSIVTSERYDTETVELQLKKVGFYSVRLTVSHGTKKSRISYMEFNVK